MLLLTPIYIYTYRIHILYNSLSYGSLASTSSVLFARIHIFPCPRALHLGAEQYTIIGRNGPEIQSMGLRKSAFLWLSVVRLWFLPLDKQLRVHWSQIIRLVQVNFSLESDSMCCYKIYIWIKYYESISAIGRGVFQTCIHLIRTQLRIESNTDMIGYSIIILITLEWRWDDDAQSAGGLWRWLLWKCLLGAKSMDRTQTMMRVEHLVGAMWW